MPHYNPTTYFGDADDVFGTTNQDEFNIACRDLLEFRQLIDGNAYLVRYVGLNTTYEHYPYNKPYIMHFGQEKQSTDHFNSTPVIYPSEATIDTDDLMGMRAFFSTFLTETDSDHKAATEAAAELQRKLVDSIAVFPISSLNNTCLVVLVIDLWFRPYIEDCHLPPEFNGFPLLYLPWNPIAMVEDPRSELLVESRRHKYFTGVVFRPLMTGSDTGLCGSSYHGSLSYVAEDSSGQSYVLTCKHVVDNAPQDGVIEICQPSQSNHAFDTTADVIAHGNLHPSSCKKEVLVNDVPVWIDMAAVELLPGIPYCNKHLGWPGLWKKSKQLLVELNLMEQ
ncbi:hypothetical protein GEMRC1_008968 [Eukaryota sp. GEM-RC1]